MATNAAVVLPFGLKRYNVAFMAFFSAVVLAGTVYSIVHKTHTFNVLLSDPHHALSMVASGDEPMPQIPATFLANRRNLLNRIFTKFAWFWTTAAFIAQAVTLRSGSHAAQSSSGAEKEKVENRSTSEKAQKSAVTTSLVRFAVATTLWIFFARWFLGPSLMERVRHYSGATCIPISSDQSAMTSTDSPFASSTLESQYCYAGTPLSAKDYGHLFGTESAADAIVRPKWKGGHDISGHTYILIISSLYLLEEIVPFMPYLLPVSLQRHASKLIPKSRWAPLNPFVVTPSQAQAKVQRNLLVLVGILLLLALWTMSLAVTAVYYHTAQEKLSGLVVALTASLLIPKGG